MTDRLNTDGTELHRKWTRRTFMSALGGTSIAGFSSAVRGDSTDTSSPSPYITNDEVVEHLQGREIAGGEGYLANISLDDTDITVADRESLTDALDSDASLIGIDGDSKIDLSGRDFTLQGQTIVSDRGIDGSPGALLYTTDHGVDSPAWDGGSNGRGLITMRGGSRISGIRLRGPYHDYYDDSEYPGYVPLDSDNRFKKRQEMRQERYARGVSVLSDDAEIDNCEIYGWPVQAIAIGTYSTVVSPHIHHIYGHDCMMTGFGYVVDVFNGHPTIESSYFNATRHSINGFGHSECGYTLEDCLFGPSTVSHAVDMHSLAENGYGDDLTAGDRVEVRRCTFLFTHDITGNDTEAIVFRGYPEDRYLTEDCWFFHEVDRDGGVQNIGNSGSEPAPYRQANIGDGWQSWYVGGNHYGLDKPSESTVGAPVDLDILNSS